MKLIFSLLSLCTILAEAQEFRSIWLSRNELTSKSQIASIIDSLANMNFNMVYVNCWSRGYPLFPSDVFKAETGISIDPNYEGRDILAETIAEAHRRGMHAGAWFEYGLVGGYNGYYPGQSGKGKIFDVHPDWVAKKQDGSEVNSVGHYWMVPTRPDVRDFLMKLHREVAEKYDIDDIEFDRIRYSGTGYGYDAYTDSVWKSGHNGSAPPTNEKDTEWMRFRADILNDFMRQSYDAIKAVNPNVNVTNAPGFYSSSSYDSYESNLQDWFQWVETGSVDHVQVQMYVGTDAALNGYLNYIFTNPIRSITKKEKIFPALAFAPNGNNTSTAELAKMVNTTRSRGMKGNAWWYWGDIGPFSSYLQSQLYTTRAEMPGRPVNWRIPAMIVNEIDTMAKPTGSWQTYQGLPGGFTGKSLVAPFSSPAEIYYAATVPADGWYEIYAYQVTSGIRSKRAPYEIFQSTGDTLHVTVDQSNAKNNGWVKLGNAQLKKGYHTVVRMSNDSIETNTAVGADAIMIMLNRKLSPEVTLTGVIRGNFKQAQPEGFRLGQNFPNPFNPETTIRFTVPRDAANITVTVFDILGREIERLADGAFSPGSHAVTFHAGHRSAGIYYYRLRAGEYTETRKMVLVK